MTEPDKLTAARAIEINLALPAGAPMVFACAGCSGPIWVPECYVVKPAHCPGCGGPWSGLVDPAVTSVEGWAGYMTPADQMRSPPVPTPSYRR